MSFRRHSAVCHYHYRWPEVLIILKVFRIGQISWTKTSRSTPKNLMRLQRRWKMLPRSRKKRNRCGSVAFDCPLDDLAVRTYSCECLFSFKVFIRISRKLKEKIGKMNHPWKSAQESQCQQLQYDFGIAGIIAIFAGCNLNVIAIQSTLIICQTSSIWKRVWIFR